jgi:uncharacterized OB-fold protein
MAKQYHLEHNQDAGAWPGEIPLRSLYTAGAAGETFFTALRDEGKILASKPKGEDIRFVPARLFCEQTFNHLDETVEVTGPGKLHTFTTCHVDKDGQRYEAPITIGFVTFDGVEGGLFGRILVDDPDSLTLGASVEVVLKDRRERVGNIADIEGFRPL